ncbi:hypothetical protein B0H19DRAFT_1065624 [Mycena capillaripes]|nr:hypothetical protein B0H19DRAFT_1065624 [Mycena capillaripes]
MTNSSTSAISSSLFTTRRRAYVACTGCRHRKIKCVKPSDADYTPCTRCMQKGLKCEYFAVADDSSSSQRSTPPPQLQVPSREQIYPDAEWTPPYITPPSAGLSPYVGPIRSSSMSIRRHTIPAGGSTHYPYKPRHASAEPILPAATLRAEWFHPPRPSSADLQDMLDWEYPVRKHVLKFNQPAQTASLYYADRTPSSSSPTAGHLDFAFEDQNYGEASVPYVPPSGMVYSWPEDMCVSSLPGWHPDADASVTIFSVKMYHHDLYPYHSFPAATPMFCFGVAPEPGLDINIRQIHQLDSLRLPNSLLLA